MLKPTGSIFVNLGDKYAGAPRGTPILGLTGNQQCQGPVRVARKSLLGLPWRYAIGCTDRLGLLLRAELVWHKTNPLPESCRDRVGRAHETWFHFTKTERSYAAVDAIREPLATITTSGSNPEASGRLGRLPRSVWPLPSQPLRLPAWLGVKHYAAFPPEWPRRLIRGFSPPGICTVCGQGRRPALHRRTHTLRGPAVTSRVNPDHKHGNGANTLRMLPDLTLDGWVCACTPSTLHPGQPPGASRLGDTRATGLNPRSTNGNLGRAPRTGAWRQYHLDGWQPPPAAPAVVLDVFGGTGTAAAVACSLGRIGISVDLSHAYSRAAIWRIFHAPGSGNLGAASSSVPAATTANQPPGAGGARPPAERTSLSMPASQRILTPPRGLSVWATAQTSQHAQRTGRYLSASTAHPARMLPAIARQAILTYTGPGDLVLDPMCGIGTSLVEAAHLGRDAIGVELEPRWATVTERNLAHAAATGASGLARVIGGDARALPELVTPLLAGPASMVLTSPPYGAHVHGQVHTPGPGTPVRKWDHRYANSPNLADLARMPPERLLAALTDILTACTHVLTPGGVVVITTRPFRRGGWLVDFPGAVISAAEQAGLTLVDRCVALLAGLNGGRLVPRASFFAMKNARDARAGGLPVQVVAHEDVLVLQHARHPDRTWF